MKNLDTKTIIWAVIAIVAIIAIGYGFKTLSERPVVEVKPPVNENQNKPENNTLTSILTIIGGVVGILGSSGVFDSNKGNYGETGGNIGPAEKPKWWEQLLGN